MSIYRKLTYFFLLLNIFPFDKCYLFSIIMAVYNTGRYLNVSLNSLFNQTISFKRIQVILVNDGSTDNSEQICLEYSEMYPKNIFYIKIEHSGVSKARNVGMALSKGKYINFLDPDDKWDCNAFKYFLLFIKFYKNIDFLAGRLKFFEADNNYHPLDYKFYKTRIVNLTKEYNCIHLSASSSIFKKSLLKGKYFEEGVFSGEDTRFVNNILLLNPIMGIIKEAVYYYRRRADFSSTVQSQKRNKDFYCNTLDSIENYLINTSINIHKKIVPFIQFFVGYDILFRIKSLVYNLLDSYTFQNYCILIEELLNKIEDKYILEQNIVSNNYKIYALSKKYHKDLRYEMKLKDNSFIYLDRKIIELNKEKYLIVWRILEIKNNILHLEGKDRFWMPKEKYFYYCKLGDELFFPKYYENSSDDFITMYGVVEKGRIVVFDIPFSTSNEPLIFLFYISIENYNGEIFPVLGFFTHIPPIPHGYYISENCIAKYIKRRLTLFKYSQNLEIKFEELYCSELRNEKKDYYIKLRKRCIKYRNKIKNNKTHEIWIINDRHSRAGDNGEFFFRYLRLKPPNGIKTYFAIDKNCSDYKRLKTLGNILDLNSQRYINVFMIADKIISSISNSWVINPFKNDHIYIRDLLHFNIIFLQHGIIKDDLSKYLNKFNKNYDLFVTSSKKEYNSLLDSSYGYSKKNIILTGLPRYDNLQNLKNIIDKEKKIIIIPTWRMDIRGTRDLITYESIHSNTFIFTDYFKFYNNLINNKRLHYFMNKYNYSGTFCLHPCFSSQWIDFDHNEYFTILEKCDYQNLLLKSSLLITDYSSIFFDFAYLRKPVIYAHFDYEEYRNNHYQEGYFDYRLDGFGPICKDIECTIDEINYEIERNCSLKTKYLKRINKFFTFSDSNNSKRILTEILNYKNDMKNPLENLYYTIYICLIFLIKYKLKSIIFNLNYYF